MPRLVISREFGDTTYFETSDGVILLKIVPAYAELQNIIDLSKASGIRKDPLRLVIEAPLSIKIFRDDIKKRQ